MYLPGFFLPISPWSVIRYLIVSYFLAGSSWVLIVCDKPVWATLIFGTGLLWTRSTLKDGYYTRGPFWAVIVSYLSFAPIFGLVLLVGYPPYIIYFAPFPGLLLIGYCFFTWAGTKIGNMLSDI